MGRWNLPLYKPLCHGFLWVTESSGFNDPRPNYSHSVNTFFFFYNNKKKRKTKKQAKRHHMDSNVMFAHSDAEQKLSRMTKAVRWLTDAANTWAFCLPFHIHSRTSSHTAKVNMFWLKRGNKNKGFSTRLLVCAEFNRNDGDKMLFPCALALGTKLCLHRSFLHTDQLLFPFSRNPLQAGDHFKQSMHTQLSWS